MMKASDTSDIFVPLTIQTGQPYEGMARVNAHLEFSNGTDVGGASELFFVDQASTRTALSYQTAEELGIRLGNLRKGMVNTASGEMSALLIPDASLSLPRADDGVLKVKLPVIHVVERLHYSIIGLDVLRHGKLFTDWGHNPPEGAFVVKRSRVTIPVPRLAVLRTE